MPGSPDFDHNDGNGGLVAKGQAGDNAAPLSITEISNLLKRTVEDRFGFVKLRGGLRRAEHREPLGAQRIRQAIDERRFGPDHDQADRALGAEGDHGAVVGEVEQDQLGMLRHARIARGRKELSAVPLVVFAEQAGLRQLPGQRMFASARSQQQDVHARPFFRRRRTPHK